MHIFATSAARTGMSNRKDASRETGTAASAAAYNFSAAAASAAVLAAAIQHRAASLTLSTRA